MRYLLRPKIDTGDRRKDYWESIDRSVIIGDFSEMRSHIAKWFTVNEGDQIVDGETVIHAPLSPATVLAETLIVLESADTGRRTVVGYRGLVKPEVKEEEEKEEEISVLALSYQLTRLKVRKALETEKCFSVFVEPRILLTVAELLWGDYKRYEVKTETVGSSSGTCVHFDLRKVFYNNNEDPIEMAIDHFESIVRAYAIKENPHVINGLRKD